MAELEGTELIKAVAERVMGWFDAEANPGRLEQPFFVAHSDAGLGVSGRPGLWNPLTSYDDAFEIVNAMRAKDYYMVLEMFGHAPSICCQFWGTKDFVEAHASIVGEAICKAALAAVKEATQ